MKRTAAAVMALCGFSQAAAEPPGATQLQPVRVLPSATASGELDPFSLETRSPYGLRYPDLWRLPGEEALFGDWVSLVATEVGYVGTSGETGTASFLEYGDFDDGLTLQRLLLRAQNPTTGSYVRANVTAAGREDQYVGVEVGRYGAFSVNAYADSVPHVFTTNARVLWDGAGTPRLTLPASLTAGASSAADVQAAFDAIGRSRVALERDRYGLAARVTPSRRLTLYASAETEERAGGRPFGGGFTYPFLGQVMETIEPINYRTHDLAAGIQFSGQKHQFNAGVTSSLFQNKTSSLVWENPGLGPFPVFEPPLGRIALAPDNQAHNLKLDYGTNLPWWRGRFTAAASYTATRQDDELAPPTITSGAVQFAGTPVDLNSWNTTAALSRRTADLEIDHWLLQTRLVLSPTRKLRLIGSVRVREEDNQSDYVALNPLTGQYGYIAMDGGVGAIIPTRSGLFDPNLPGSRVRIRSIPFERDEGELRIAAQYRLTSKTRLSAEYSRQRFDYAFRERSEVDDDNYSLELQRRGLLGGVLKVTAERKERSGGAYNPNPYELFYSSSLPQFTPLLPGGNPPHTLAQLRKYDLADQDENRIRARWNIILTPALDLAIAATTEKQDFAAEYGLRESSARHFNAELNYQIGPHHNLFFYLSRSEHEREVANINDAGGIATDPNAGGVVYPLANAWAEQVDETTDSFGGGYRIAFDSGVTLDLSYAYSQAESAFDYTFNSTRAFFGSAAEVGTGFPEQSFRHWLATADLRIPVGNRYAIRLVYRFEDEEIDDFHYLGLDNPVIGSDILLAAFPESYSGSSYMVLLETKF